MTQAIQVSTATFAPVKNQSNPLPWRYLAASEHEVHLLNDAGEPVKSLVFGVEYTITPEGDTLENAGVMQLIIDPPATATQMRVRATTAMTQNFISTPKSKGVEAQLDRITLVQQQMAVKVNGITYDEDALLLAKNAAAASAAQAAQDAARFPELQTDLQAIASRVDGEPSLVDVAQLIAQPVTANKFDPAIADVGDAGDVTPAIGSSSANQISRVRNNQTGLLSVQAASLWSYWASKKTHLLEPSTEYTMSIHGAPLGAYIYPNDFFQFYNADGSLHSYITSGFTVDNPAAPRQITFTTPAAAVSIAPNIRNITEFTLENPITAEHVDIVQAATMLNKGATALDFIPYSDGAFTPISSDLDPVAAGQIVVAKQGHDYYIRAAAQQSTTKDVVWKVIANSGVNYNAVDNKNGAVNFHGIRFIDKATGHKSTIAAYNQSTDVHSNGFDESCPIKINGMYLGGGHGVIGRKAKMTGHGKTNVDVGSIWSDGTDQWVLHYVDDADNATFVAKNTGPADKWSISTAALGSTTMSHVSGATNTADFVLTAQEQSQSAPTVKEYLAELRVDNVSITADGVYSGARVQLAETYALMNMAAQQDYLIANVGAATPSYDNAAIKDQVRFAYVFEWNEFGAMSVRAGHGVHDAYSRAANSDYWGAFQLQRLSLPGDSVAGMQSSVSLYVPDVSPVGGYDFKAVADITANAAEVRVPITSCDDPADPASHFALIGRTSGVDKSGHLYGYNRDVGLGVPAARAAHVTDCMILSPADKSYPVAIDAKAGDAAVDDADLITAFRAPFLPTDADLTVPAVVVDMDGATYCYITAHQTLTDKQVALPDSVSGKKVTVVKASTGATVSSAYVTGGQITFTTTGGYGDVVLRLD